jgi:CRISPR-associated protein Csm4
MLMLVYQLEPLTPFHFGERGIGVEETSEFPHSDTLLSALIIAWRLGRGDKEWENWLAALVSGRPPLRMSSAFPYAGPVCFLPRPLIPLAGEDEAEQIDPKLSKKVEWVSWRRMEDILNGDTPPRVEARDLLMGGRIWVKEEDRLELENQFGMLPSRFRIWSAGAEETIPRVTVDRIDNSPALYYQGQVRFAPGCGLYILAVFDPEQEETYRPAVTHGLSLLGELGLGGRRSTGLGHFQLSESELDETIEQPPETGDVYHMLLSLYHPRQDEVATGVLSGARYKLLTRRGWFFSLADTGQRRRSVRMLAEGSLLARPAAGDLVNVAPEAYKGHPVYRSGLALTVRSRRWSYV